MKRKFSIAAFLLGLVAPIVSAQSVEELTVRPVGDVVYRNYIEREYKEIYSLAPSLLSQWTDGKYANIRLGYDNEKGDFRNFQSHDELNAFEVSTESLYGEGEDGWSFYGKFSYLYTVSNGVNMNLDHDLPQTGSPNYFFARIPGDWRSQTYHINGVVSKSLLDDKLAVGVGLLYESDLNFRQVDVRNERYDLRLSITPSVTWSYSDRGALTVGGEFFRSKHQPALSYKNQSGAEPYYLNMGLGSFETFTTILELECLDIRPTAILAWNYRTPKTVSTVGYKFTSGTEDYHRRATSTLASGTNDIAKYEYMIHDLTLSSKLDLGRDIVSGRMFMMYRSGTNYEIADQKYLDNFNRSDIEIGWALDYMRNGSIFRRVGITGEMFNSAQKDLNYAQDLIYTNLSLGAEADFIYNINRSSIALTLMGGYKMNMDMSNPQGAASEIIPTLNIINSQVSYLSTNYYNVGAQLKVSLPLGKEYVGDFIIGGEYLKPTATKYPDPNKYFDLESDYVMIDARVVFNF